MRKTLCLDDNFYTGENTVQPMVIWNQGHATYTGVKTASAASDYIRSVQPKPGYTIVLVLALGAYERYDLNRNGDGFNELPFKEGYAPSCGHAACRGSAWITASDTLLHHYKSFEETGKVFRHHVNKDPSKAIGDVLKAFWNSYMHRVELLIGVKDSLAQDLSLRIADGEYPAVSMGCRIKYDVCTICGHRAPTRKEYCRHLLDSMRQVMPNGLRAGALNPCPRFFDISFVAKPADLTGYMLKKVAEHGPYVISSASLGEVSDRLDEKRAAIRKIADIDKIVQGITIDHKSSPVSPAEAANIRAFRKNVASPALKSFPDFDDRTLVRLGQNSIPQVLATLGAAGVILTTPEFVKMMMAKLAPGVELPDTTLDAILATQNSILQMYAAQPQLLDQVLETNILNTDGTKIDPHIGQIAERYLEKRSYIEEYFNRHLFPNYETAPSGFDTHNVRDPSTGALYTTNNLAINQAKDSIAKRELHKMLGGAALLAGAAKIGHGAMAKWGPAAQAVPVAGAILAGMHFLRPNYGPQFQTEDGLTIPVSTQFLPSTKQGSAIGIAAPMAGMGALVSALSHDYESRLRNGDVGNPDAPIFQRLRDKITGVVHDHPALTWLAGTIGGAHLLGKTKYAESAQDVLDSCVIPDHGDPETSGMSLPKLDVDKLATAIGKVLLP